MYLILYIIDIIVNIYIICMFNETPNFYSLVKLLKLLLI